MGFSRTLWDKPNSDTTLRMGLFKELQTWSLSSSGYKVTGFDSYRGCKAAGFQVYCPAA